MSGFKIFLGHLNKTEWFQVQQQTTALFFSWFILLDWSYEGGSDMEI